MGMKLMVMCDFCARRHLPDTGGMTVCPVVIESCSAYPGGIPAAIREGRADHRRRYRGDGGKTFLPDVHFLTGEPVTDGYIDMILGAKRRDGRAPRPPTGRPG